MRLFIAIPIPKDIKSYLKSIKVPGKIVADYHLTLAFLGESESVAIDVAFSDFELELDHLGAFPSKQRPRVVWVGLKNSKVLLKLQQQIAAALKIENRFHPHITLSRIRQPVQMEFGEVESRKFKVESFELISSNLTPQGPIYETIKTFKSKNKKLEQ